MPEPIYLQMPEAPLKKHGRQFLRLLPIWVLVFWPGAGGELRLAALLKHLGHAGRHDLCRFVQNSRAGGCRERARGRPR